MSRNVGDYQLTLGNISEERRSHLNHGGSFKSSLFFNNNKETYNRSTVQDKIYNPAPPIECSCFNVGALAPKCPELNSITCRPSLTSPLITQPMANCPVQLITWAFRIRTAYGQRDTPPHPTKDWDPQSSAQN